MNTQRSVLEATSTMPSLLPPFGYPSNGLTPVMPPVVKEVSVAAPDSPDRLTNEEIKALLADIPTTSVLGPSGYRWSQRGLPHQGWQIVEAYDNGKADHVCEMCGKEDIRYVFVLAHDDCPNLRPRVGCVCAVKLTDDHAHPKDLERQLVNRAKRRDKWVKLRWRQCDNGDSHLRTIGHHIYVRRDGASSSWAFRIVRECSETGISGRGAGYASEELAKLAAFDHLCPSKSGNHSGPARGCGHA